jgi:hypothetical protein
LRGHTLFVPSEIPGLLEIFIKEKEFSKKDIQHYMDIYKAYKDYEHGRVKDISGKDLDIMIKKAYDFIDDCQNVAMKIMAQ